MATLFIDKWIMEDRVVRLILEFAVTKELRSGNE